MVCPLYADLTDLEGGVIYNDINSLLEYVNTLSQYQVRLVFLNTTTTNTLIGISGQSKGFVTKRNSNDNYFDFFLIITNGASVFTGRYEDGTVTAFKLTTTAV